MRVYLSKKNLSQLWSESQRVGTMGRSGATAGQEGRAKGPAKQCGMTPECTKVVRKDFTLNPEERKLFLLSL